MKYTVTGPLPIATANGDVPPGQTLDEEDLDERTNVGALVLAGHLKEAPAVRAPEKPKDKA